MNTIAFSIYIFYFNQLKLYAADSGSENRQFQIAPPPFFSLCVEKKGGGGLAIFPFVDKISLLLGTITFHNTSVVFKTDPSSCKPRTTVVH